MISGISYFVSHFYYHSFNLSFNTLETKSIKVFHIAIQRGSLPGERYTYENEGDESPDTKPGDVICILDEELHNHLRRKSLHSNNNKNNNDQKNNKSNKNNVNNNNNNNKRKDLIFRCTSPIRKGDIFSCQSVYFPNGQWKIIAIPPKVILPAILNNNDNMSNDTSTARKMCHHVIDKAGTVLY